MSTFYGEPNTSSAGLVRVVEDPTGTGSMNYNGKNYRFVDTVMRGDVFTGSAGTPITHHYFGDNVELNGQNWVFLASGIQLDNTPGGFDAYTGETSRTVYFRDGNSSHVNFYYIQGNSYDHILSIQGIDKIHEIAVRKALNSSLRIGLPDGSIGSIGMVSPVSPSASPVRIQTNYGIMALERINKGAGKWINIDYSFFHYSSNPNSIIQVYDNGDAQIAIHKSKITETAYRDQVEDVWKLTNVAWWVNATPNIYHSSDGVFLATISGFANVFSSFNGKDWYIAGFMKGGQGTIQDLVYEPTSGVGLCAWWNATTALYESSDSLTERTEWTLVPNAPLFRTLEAYQGKFVGISGNDTLLSASPHDTASWEVVEDTYKYIGMKRVHDKLFVLRYKYEGGIFDTELVTVNSSVDGIVVTNLTHVGGLGDPQTPSVDGITWIEDIKRYLIFLNGKAWTSFDGITWMESQAVPFNNNILYTSYVPDDGVYVTLAGGSMKYSPLVNLI